MTEIFLVKKYYFIPLMILSAVILSTVYLIEIYLELPPCKLCIYQRVPYFFSLIICLFSFFLTNKKYLIYILFFVFTMSMIVSFYHSLVERGLINFEIGCTSMNQDFSNIDDLKKYLDEVPIAKCDEILFSVFGLSLANINFLISFLINLLNLYFFRKVYESKN